jgi:predicted aldo/keto reductase-like oxidoreductase
MLAKTTLGNTGINVTKLGFGTLVMGSLQANLPPEEGAKVIRRALVQGISFLDTAHVYGSYEHIRQAKEGWKQELVITTKTPASDYDKAERHINHALEALDVESLDIMLMHAARAGEDVFQERAGAYQCLCDYKQKGLIKAIGVSTHHAGTVRVAGSRDDVDVIHPLINMAGTGILGGTVEDMASAIAAASLNGKGIYAMKALAGGSLLERMDEAFKFVMGLPGIDAVVVGMVSEAEVDMNCRIFRGEAVHDKEREVTVREKRLKIVEVYCKGCGRCVNACPNGALSMVEGFGSHARIDLHDPVSLRLIQVMCSSVPKHEFTLGKDGIRRAFHKRHNLAERKLMNRSHSLPYRVKRDLSDTRHVSLIILTEACLAGSYDQRSFCRIPDDKPFPCLGIPS